MYICEALRLAVHLGLFPTLSAYFSLLYLSNTRKKENGTALSKDCDYLQILNGFIFTIKYIKIPYLMTIFLTSV